MTDSPPPPHSSAARLLAHSLPDQPETEWEGLCEHANHVASLAAMHAAAFGCEELARAAGLLHDLGKASEEFQRHIRRPAGTGQGPDHSSAGARQALLDLPPRARRWLAPIIAGHHGGLPDPEELRSRLERPVPDWQRGLAELGPLPPVEALALAKPLAPGPWPGFAEAFRIRMLFSCLVDADRLATRAFYGDAPEVGRFTTLETLRDRLRAHMAGLPKRADPTLDALRDAVLAHATGKAAMPPGLFTLTVPTGGGKTLASLSFALGHAAHHGLRRVVYVIPFTSIVEQTAGVFRGALGGGEDVLEHHSLADWDEDTPEAGAGDGLAKRRRDAAENWSAPVVVTTAVQFFESLFSNHPSRCRKLHSLARAVVVLDEAQTLPLPLLRPCLAALDELARSYGTSVVLCTATQPAVRTQDGFTGGLDIPSERELAPNPSHLYSALRRVSVEVRPGTAPVSDEELAARFAQAPRMLCIVNFRGHARALFDAIRAQEGAVHLSTLMCPAHRSAVLAEVRDRLDRGRPVRLVSTTLVEAGVDVSFPEVWRASAGLDSLAQAAGRCNRHGEMPGAAGRVVMFEAAEARWKPRRDLAPQLQAARETLRRHGDDPLGLKAIRAYFASLYWQKGEGELDSELVESKPGILAALARHRDKPVRDLGKGFYPFRSIAEAFRMIDDVMVPVVVPWGDAGKHALKRFHATPIPSRADWRAIQAFTIGVPQRARDAWLPILSPLGPTAEHGPFAFADDALYRPETGLDLEAAGLRNAEANIIGA